MYVQYTNQMLTFLHFLSITLSFKVLIESPQKIMSFSLEENIRVHACISTIFSKACVLSDVKGEN